MANGCILIHKLTIQLDQYFRNPVVSPGTGDCPHG
jgi:hypothetical protein